MKKALIPIIGIGLLLVGLVSWRSTAYSNVPPYPNPNVDEPNLSKCTKTTANQIYVMREAWKKNLAVMMDQEKPASEMVDEGFESNHTYRCWLDYLCEAVLYSANADPKSTLKDPQDSASGYRALVSSRYLGTMKGEIETVPGCAYSDKLEIPETQIQYIPACQVGAKDANDGKTIAIAQANYAECRRQVDQEAAFAFTALQATLKDNSAQQQVRPLRDKFSSIILQLHAMESHMTTLTNQVVSLDSRLPCYAAKCD